MAIKTKLIVRHAMPGNKNNSETFNCDPEKINVNMSSDTAVQVDNWARGYVALTNESYVDAEISQTTSVLDIINE